MSAVVDTYRAAQRAGEFNAGPRQGVAQYTGSRPQKQAPNGGFTVLNAASTRAAERASAIIQTEYHHRTAPILIWSRVVPLGVQQRVPLEHTPPLVERSGGGLLCLLRPWPETAGLESGEVGWILGKQFTPPRAEDYCGAHAHDARPSMRTAEGLLAVREEERKLREQELAHESNKFGVEHDQLRRMAPTRWVEGWFRHTGGRQRLDLATVDVFCEQHLFLDADVALYSEHAPAASLFAVPDLAYALQAPPPQRDAQGREEWPNEKPLEDRPGPVAVPLLQGLEVMAKGPFLKSFGTGAEEALLRAGGAQWRAPRHLGGRLAQSALWAQLKLAGALNWTPDGIITSVASEGVPTDDPRSLGMLVRQAIMGEGITKTWCEPGVRTPIAPRDRVYLLLVGDLSYRLGAPDAALRAARQLTGATLADEAVREEAHAALSAAVADRGIDDGETPLQAAHGALEAALAEWDERPEQADEAGAEQGAAALAGVRRAWSAARAAVGDVHTAEGRAGRAVAVAPSYTGQPSAFDADALEVRGGRLAVTHCTLENLRLMRTTSSALAGGSHNGYVPSDKADDAARSAARARLGLPIVYDASARSGTSAMIVGGWCVGTCTDPVATRSVTELRVNATHGTETIAVAVHPQWVSADELHRRYMDADVGADPPEDWATRKGARATLAACGARGATPHPYGPDGPDPTGPTREVLDEARAPVTRVTGSDRYGLPVTECVYEADPRVWSA